VGLFCRGANTNGNSEEKGGSSTIEILDQNTEGCFRAIENSKPLV
jgi:hypothetical protein